MRDDWSDVPHVLTMRETAALLRIHVKTLQIKARAGHPSVPRPALIRPYRWRRSDVRRWVETESVEHQRQARAQYQRETAAEL